MTSAAWVSVHRRPAWISAASDLLQCAIRFAVVRVCGHGFGSFERVDAGSPSSCASSSAVTSYSPHDFTPDTAPAPDNAADDYPALRCRSILSIT